MTNISSEKPTSESDLTHDNLFKIVYGQTDGTLPFSADLLNIIFEQGELQELDPSTLKLESSLLTELAKADRPADLVFSILPKGGGMAAKLILLLEHKSYRDYGLLQQMLAYQARLLLREDERCYVLPFVIYHGELRNWTVELEYRASRPPLPEALEPRFGRKVMNFECVLVNLHDVVESGAVSEVDSKVVLYAMSQVWNVDESTYEEAFRQLKKLDKSKREFLEKIVINYLYQHDAVTSRETIFAIEERIFPEGMRKMRDLFIEARQEGIEQGIEQGREEITMDMIHHGIDIDSICGVTGLDREQVETVRRKYENQGKGI